MLVRNAVWLALALASPSVWAQQQAREAAEVPDSVEVEGERSPTVACESTDEVACVEFDRDLLLESGPMLQGITATETVKFRVSPRWEGKGAPILHLNFDHSDSLIPTRSTLSVRINGQGVASTALTPENSDEGYLRIRIPPRVLSESGYNDITFMVVQHVTDDCEDPFDPALWTRVSATSYLEIPRAMKPIEGRLEDFPSPIFEDLGYGPFEVALAGLGDVSPTQLDALGVLGFSMGRWASYRGVDIKLAGSDTTKANTHLLVVGTPRENPMVNQFIDTSGLRAGVGRVAVLPNPARPAQGVIVVTGGDANGVIKAAKALASEDRYELLAGSVADVDTIDKALPVETRRIPLPVPPAPTPAQQRMEFEDLRIKDQTVRGFYAPPVRIPLNLEGDAEVHVDGARVGIDYAYSALLDNELSTMEVRLNDVTLRSIALDEADGEPKARLWVDLPFELLKPDAQLEVVFHLFPINRGECIYVNDKHIWGTVFKTSELRITRDRYAELPDLGLVRHDLWPMTPALHDDALTVVVDDDPTPLDAAAMTQLLGELGARSATDMPVFRVVRGTANDVGPGSSTIAVLNGEGRNGGYDRLKNSGLVTSEKEDVRRRLTEGGDQLLDARMSASYGTVEQVVTGKGKDATVSMIIDAPTDASLLNLVKLMGDPSVTAGLSGNISVVGQDGAVRALDVVPEAAKVGVGTRSLAGNIKRAFNNYWGVLGLAVLVSALLLAFIVRGWAARRGGHA